MTPRLSGHISIFGLVFFVHKSLLGITRQWSRKKIAILSLICRTWPIGLLFEGRLALIPGFIQCGTKQRLPHLYTKHMKCFLDGDRCEEVQLYLHRRFLLRFKWELDRDRVRYQFRDCASYCTTPRDSWPRTTALPNIHGSPESSCESYAEREKPRVYMFRV